MTKLFAFALPVMPGQKDHLKKFMTELTNRKKEFNDSRKKLGIHERTFLQSSPNGDTVIVTVEGENPQEAFMKLAQQKDDFTKWFISNVKEIHGIDLTQKPDMTTELIMESEPVATSVLG